MEKNILEIKNIEDLENQENPGKIDQQLFRYLTDNGDLVPVPKKTSNKKQVRIDKNEVGQNFKFVKIKIKDEKLSYRSRINGGTGDEEDLTNHHFLISVALSVIVFLLLAIVIISRLT